MKAMRNQIGFKTKKRNFKPFIHGSNGTIIQSGFRSPGGILGTNFARSPRLHRRNSTKLKNTPVLKKPTATSKKQNTHISLSVIGIGIKNFQENPQVTITKSK
jgi:hypothetical protein